MPDETEIPEIPEVNVQPALPTLELPDFEGVKPVGVVTRVNGAGQRINRAMHYEEKVVLVVECEVANVGHGKTNDGMKRIHTLAVRDLYELEGKAGKSLLRSLRQAYRVADDARHGRRVLPGMGPVERVAGATGWTDASGTAYTDEELAEIRGETILGLPIVDAAVLVFDGGARALWPDDFPDEAVGSRRPAAGAQVVPPGKDDEKTVRQVLDVDTGETLEEWSDEQEAARLLEVEQEAIAAEKAAAEEEARLDREAHEEALSKRGEIHAVPDVGAPVEGYDDMTVREISDYLAELDDQEQLLTVIAYEEANGGRKGVLKAAARRAAELGEAGE